MDMILRKLQKTDLPRLLSLEESNHAVPWSEEAFQHCFQANYPGWVLENEKPDMLVMVHRKSSLLDFFFKSSITKKIAADTTVPLLVYPYPIDTIPVF